MGSTQVQVKDRIPGTVVEGLLERAYGSSGLAKRHLNDPTRVVAIRVVSIQPDRSFNRTLGLRKHQNTSMGDGKLVEAVCAVGIQS